MLESWFKLSERSTDLRTEVIAGLTTFLTAAYIVFVNPGILSAAGMDKGALITVTCLVAGLSSILMGVWANAPIMMAPGMGLNAFFAFSLVIGAGVPWQEALGVVFISGVIFLILTFIGVRERVVKAIPPSLRIATSVGIGLFIAFIGMQGLGLIVNSDAVLVGLGDVKSKTVLLGLLGILLIIVLEIRKIKGSILIGILATALVGMIFKVSPFPGGFVSMPPSMAPVAFKLDILGALKVSLWASIFSFMFVDLFDSLGTLLAVCREAGLEKDGDIKGLPKMLSADAVATVFGSILGTSTTTSYIESASGVAVGGRTGITAITTGILFLLAAFFTPVIGSVQAYATAPALIIVGIFMMRGIGQINFYDFEEGVPAFLTLVLMPLTYSIAQGLVFGFISYTLIKVLIGKVREVDPVLMIIAALCVVSLLI
ncbi:MAG: NCS2 family permease [bacterium]|nr:NCS2 family permease [bacterium]